jgi:hypothetical protein
MRGDAISAVGSILVRFWFDFRVGRTKVPNSRALARFEAPIAVIDNDGDAEVIFGSAVFDSTGKLLYEGVPGIGLNGQGPISCVADLDNDGRQEVIAGRTAYAFTGTVAMNNFVGKVLWTAAPTDGFCGVADFNGDKKPEVVLVSNANIYALNGQTGATLAQAPIPNGGKGGPPNIADFDGDKVPEIAAAGSSQYIVYKYAGANAFVKLWSAATQDGSSQVTGSSRRRRPQRGRLQRRGVHPHLPRRRA